MDLWAISVGEGPPDTWLCEDRASAGRQGTTLPVAVWLPGKSGLSPFEEQCSFGFIENAIGLIGRGKPVGFRASLAMQDTVHFRRPCPISTTIPGNCKGIGIRAAALETGAVTGGQGCHLIKKEQFSVTVTHNLSMPVLELKHAGNPLPARPLPGKRLAVIMNPTAPIAHQGPTRLCRDDPAIRPDTVLQGTAGHRRRSGVSISDMDIVERLSPNFNARRNGLTPSLVVLHYTAMASAEAALQRLCDPDCEVSAHYLVDRFGAVTRMVSEDMRAWHAGAGAWGGMDDVNSRSIGIELDNPGHHPFPEAQMRVLEDLLGGVLTRWSISPSGVIAHSDMAPDRKSDPGRRFDWKRLAMGGLSIWPAPVQTDGASDPDRFLRAACAIGYPVSHGLEPALSAFRQRFRPWGQGSLSADDVARAEAVAAVSPALDRARPAV